MGCVTAGVRVSCIMIFLDGEEFMDEAITSVVGQMEFDAWELILVDDGSTDGSAEIARRWMRTDPTRITYVHHPGLENRGMSASRNLGLRHARGELVAFLDCDDVWLPWTLAHASRVLDRYANAEALIAPCWIWSSWEAGPARPRDWLPDLPRGLPTRVVLEPPALFESLYGSRPWLVPWMCSLVIRRDAIIRVGGFEDRFRTHFEDQVLYAKLGLELSVVLDARPLALYRQHDSATTSGLGADQISSDAGRAFLEWLEPYVDAVWERHTTVRSQSGQRPVVAVDVAVPRRRTRAKSWLVGRWRRLVPRHLQEMVRRMRGTDVPENVSVHRLLKSLCADRNTDVYTLWICEYVSWRSADISGRVCVIDPGGELPPDPSSLRGLLPAATAVASSASHEELEGAFDWAVIVVTRDDPDPAAYVEHASRLVTPGGGAIVFAPGPAGPGRSNGTALDSTELSRIATEHFPGRDVHTESFGSHASLASLGETAALSLDGAEIDRHDPRIEVLLVGVVEPTG